MNNIFLIQKPWITEKSVLMNKDRKYVFLVESSSTKNEVKKAVKTMFGVESDTVAMINIPGKMKRFRGRQYTSSGYKKAIVTLKVGQTIAVQ